jgi:hypothetical protein
MAGDGIYLETVKLTTSRIYTEFGVCVPYKKFMIKYEFCKNRLSDSDNNNSIPSFRSGT